MERPDELKANEDVRQLKAEISDTQAELQQTVAEIQDRLNPSALKHQAADTVRDAASNVREATVGRVQHMVRGQNPIPFALIGIGAAWLLASNRRSNGSAAYREYDASWNQSTSYLSSDDEFASPYAEASFADGSGRTGRLGEAGSEARRKAAEASRQARERARRVASQARTRWDHMIHENPMALGIAALAAGAVVGAALPGTRVEDEYLGETRDQLLDSARSIAHDTAETARSAAKETIEKATGSQPEPRR